MVIDFSKDEWDGHEELKTKEHKKRAGMLKRRMETILSSAVVPIQKLDTTFAINIPTSTFKEMLVGFSFV